MHEVSSSSASPVVSAVVVMVYHDIALELSDTAVPCGKSGSGFGDSILLIPFCYEKV